MKKNNKYSLAIFLFFSCLVADFTLHTTLVRSQIKVTPLVIEEQAEKGQDQSVIELTNLTNEPVRFRLYANYFTYGDNGFQLIENCANATITTLPPDGKNIDCANDLRNYLQFAPRELVIQPNKMRQVRLVTIFPPNLPEGEYRAVIFSERLIENIDTNSNVKVGLLARIGTTLYVRQGNVSAKLNAASANWNPDKKKLQVLVKNTGNASSRISLRWTLKQGEKVIAKSPETRLETSVIANSQRQVLLEAAQFNQAAIAPGEYQLVGTLGWGLYQDLGSMPFEFKITIPAHNSDK